MMMMMMMSTATWIMTMMLLQKMKRVPVGSLWWGWHLPQVGPHTWRPRAEPTAKVIRQRQPENDSGSCWVRNNGFRMNSGWFGCCEFVSTQMQGINLHFTSVPVHSALCICESCAGWLNKEATGQNIIKQDTSTSFHKLSTDTCRENKPHPTLDTLGGTPLSPSSNIRGVYH